MNVQTLNVLIPVDSSNLQEEKGRYPIVIVPNVYRIKLVRRDDTVNYQNGFHTAVFQKHILYSPSYQKYCCPTTPGNPLSNYASRAFITLARLQAHYSYFPEEKSLSTQGRRVDLKSDDIEL